MVILLSSVELHYCRDPLPLSLSVQIKDKKLSVMEETYGEDQDACSSTPKVNNFMLFVNYTCITIL